MRGSVAAPPSSPSTSETTRLLLFGSELSLLFITHCGTTVLSLSTRLQPTIVACHTTSKHTPLDDLRHRRRDEITTRCKVILDNLVLDWPLEKHRVYNNDLTNVLVKSAKSYWINGRPCKHAYHQSPAIGIFAHDPAVSYIDSYDPKTYSRCWLRIFHQSFYLCSRTQIFLISCWVSYPCFQSSV